MPARCLNAGRPFGRQEVAVMHAAMRVDELDPAAAEAFEVFDLRRIDDVLNHAGDHATTLTALTVNCPSGPPP